MGRMSDLTALNLAPGNLVGGYTLISRLGGGAMGSVWRVKDDGGNIYAMKILRDSLGDDGDGTDGFHQGGEDTAGMARERLRREAAALRRVNHPGVCQIVDMELDDSLAFIVTELIEGKNLREDVLANGKYVAGDLERLARKLIDAVAAVHRAGIIHRDIKPTNVMVSRTGPVLVDFGIAMGEGESHVTRTGLVMGTPGFIAPEIIDGAESDETTDWWSTSAVLAFAATGQPVFGSKPMMAVLERAAAGNANLSGLPPRTTAAFRSALSPRRGDRCTPLELLQTIEQDAMTPELWTGAESGAAGPASAASAASADDSTDSAQHANGFQPVAEPGVSALPGKPVLSGAMPTAMDDHHDDQHNADEGGEAGVVRPFGKSSSDSTDAFAAENAVDNPRSLWKALDERRAALTQVIGVEPLSTNDSLMEAAESESISPMRFDEPSYSHDDYSHDDIDDGFGTDEEWNVDKPSIVLAGQTRVVPVDRAPSDSPAFQPADPPLPESVHDDNDNDNVSADDTVPTTLPSRTVYATASADADDGTNADTPSTEPPSADTIAVTPMPASYPAPVHSYDQLDWLNTDGDNANNGSAPESATNPLSRLQTLGDESDEQKQGELDHLFDSLPAAAPAIRPVGTTAMANGQPMPNDQTATSRHMAEPRSVQSTPNQPPVPRVASSNPATSSSPVASSNPDQTRIIGPDPVLGTTTLVQAPTIGEPPKEPPITGVPVASTTVLPPTRTASNASAPGMAAPTPPPSPDMDATLVYGQPGLLQPQPGQPGQPQPGYAPDPYAQQYDQQPQYDQYGHPYDQQQLPQPQPEQPPYQPREDHADVMRSWYVPRGRMIMCLLAAPLCLFTASTPAAGLMSASFLLWAFTVMGLSRNSQLERENKRGGLRKGTDGALIIGSLPWHLIKGLALTVIPTLLMLALFAALTAFLTTALMLPSTTGTILAFGTQLRFPLLAGSALSASGFTLMACMAAAWFAAALGPYSRFARLGAGTLRGDLGAPSPSIDANLAAAGAPGMPPPEEQERLQQSAHRRGWTLTLIWLVLILAGVAMLLAGGSIDWAPIMLD
ncbi:hypothetical protein EP30_06340 [Bifidobacterium sp. UTCIF-39]|nr:hypothetical protein EP30_06340 [Bifidobacterium sp. UTCIF-39]